MMTSSSASVPLLPHRNLVSSNKGHPSPTPPSSFSHQQNQLLGEIYPATMHQGNPAASSPKLAYLQAKENGASQETDYRRRYAQPPSPSTLHQEYSNSSSFHKLNANVATYWDKPSSAPILPPPPMHANSSTPMHRHSHAEHPMSSTSAMHSSTRARPGMDYSQAKPRSVPSQERGSMSVVANASYAQGFEPRSRPTELMAHGFQRHSYLEYPVDQAKPLSRNPTSHRDYCTSPRELHATEHVARHAPGSMPASSRYSPHTSRPEDPARAYHASQDRAAQFYPQDGRRSRPTSAHYSSLSREYESEAYRRYVQGSPMETSRDFRRVNPSEFAYDRRAHLDYKRCEGNGSRQSMRDAKAMVPLSGVRAQNPPVSRARFNETVRDYYYYYYFLAVR
jgi:hypothetical protein